MLFSLRDKVTFAYNGGPAILRDLQFHLEAGQTVALLGGNGLGKTTLLNLLALVWDKKLPQGQIVYYPHSPKAHGASEILYDTLAAGEKARLRREEFGLMPQIPHFLSGFTCKQNLRMPLSLLDYSARRADQRIDDMLDRVKRLNREAGEKLKKKLDTRTFPKQLSTGQLQCLSVLRTVLHDPVVLFADEPVSNLDAQHKHLMLDLFTHWQNGDLSPSEKKGKRSLILICHEAETAWQMADCFLFLNPPAPGPNQPAGATIAQPLDRDTFCKLHAIDRQHTDAPARGAEAIRRHIRAPGSVGTIPALPPQAAPGGAVT